jgi:hypothetical protein
MLLIYYLSSKSELLLIILSLYTLLLSLNPLILTLIYISFWVRAYTLYNLVASNEYVSCINIFNFPMTSTNHSLILCTIFLSVLGTQ